MVNTKMAAAVFAASAALAAAALGDVTKVDSPVRIDGRLDEPIWEKAKWEGGFKLLSSAGKEERARKPSVKTEFAFLADQDSVYIGVRAADDRMNELVAQPRTAIWGAESVEIFLSPDGGAFEYYQFVVTFQGDVHQLFFSEGGHTRPDPYAPAWEHKTAVADGGWSAEVRIPLSAFYMTRNKLWRGTWGVNVARNFKRFGKRGMENSCWCDTERFYGEPSRFRKVSGFPMRRAEDDVFMKSAVAVAGADVLNLSVTVAKGGRFAVSSTYSDPVEVVLPDGESEVRLPSRFPKNGRHLTHFKMVRKSGASVYERDYPVVFDVRPIRLKLDKPQYRSNFYPGQDASRVVGSVATIADRPVALTLEGPGFGRKEVVLAKGGAFSFDTTGFSDGDATLTARCGEDVLTKRIRKLPPLPAGQHMSWVENGNLVVDGKPVFRRNMYAEGFMGGKAFDRKYKEDDQHQTPVVKCIGNFDPTWFDKTIKYGEALEDREPSRRMLDHVDRIIEEGRSQKGCYYYICDEPECFNLSAVWLRHVYEYVAEKDPYHAILSCCRSGEPWIDIADWFEVHPYINAHFDSAGRRAYTRQFHELGDFVDMFRPEAHPDKVIGGVPTAFAYERSDYPTFDEYVLNFWCELVRGAKTMYPYVYHDFCDRAGLYVGTRYMFETIENLEDVFLFGKRETLSRSRESEATVWTMPDGERLLAVLNFTQNPVRVRLPGLAGEFCEYRCGRALKFGNRQGEVSLKPLESLIALTSDRDRSLKTLADTRAEIARIEYERTHRDNQLFEREGEIAAVTSNGKRGGHWDSARKLFDGNRVVTAWRQKGGRERFYELVFSKFVPEFDTVSLYGSGIEGYVVRIREDGRWRALVPEKVERDGYRITYRFGKKLSTVRFRLEFPLNDVEVYELELPGSFRRLDDSSWRPLFSDEAWRVSLPDSCRTNMRWKVKRPDKPSFLCFRLGDTPETRDSLYTEWNLSLEPKPGMLAKSVGPALRGYYTLRLPAKAAGDPDPTLVLRNFNLTFRRNDIVCSSNPSDSAEFVREGGMCRVTVRLSSPCEDIACSVFSERGRGVVPVRVNGSGNAIELRPVEGDRCVWEGRVPAPEKSGAKIDFPLVRVDVLGGALREPIYTWLSD